LSVFARLGCNLIAVPYDITQISSIADELESGWHRMMLLIDHLTEGRSERLRAVVRKTANRRGSSRHRFSWAGSRFPSSINLRRRPPDVDAPTLSNSHMDDKRKTKAHLIGELEELRRRVAASNGERRTAQTNRSRLFARGLRLRRSAIFIFQDSVFRYTNPATSKITGYKAEELLGANIWTFVHPEHRELMEERSWLATRRTGSFQVDSRS